MVFNVDLKQVTLEGLQEELAVQRAMSQDDFRGNILRRLRGKKATVQMTGENLPVFYQALI